MTVTDEKSLVIPEVSLYNPQSGEDIILTNIHIDTDYVCDAEGRVIYFNMEESKTYLEKQGKSVASLPLQVIINHFPHNRVGVNDTAIGPDSGAGPVPGSIQLLQNPGSCFIPAGEGIKSHVYIDQQGE